MHAIVSVARALVQHRTQYTERTARTAHASVVVSLSLHSRTSSGYARAAAEYIFIIFPIMGICLISVYFVQILYYVAEEKICRCYFCFPFFASSSSQFNSIQFQTSVATVSAPFL